jgi:hypothetical protein
MDACHNPSCGHTHEAHSHFREGSDCSLCDCASFQHLPTVDEVANDTASAVHEVVDTVTHAIAEAAEHVHLPHRAANEDSP